MSGIGVTHENSGVERDYCISPFYVINAPDTLEIHIVVMWNTAAHLEVSYYSTLTTAIPEIQLIL